MARILAIRDYQLCFLSDTILVGLWENGHDVYESPVLEQLRGRVDEGYILPDGNRGYSACPGYLRNAPLPEQSHTEEEVRDLLASNGFDLIVLLSLREHSLATLNRLIPSIQDREKLPIVACCGEDYDWINIPLIQEQIKPKVFFKREMKKSYKFEDYTGQVGVPVFPCQFASFTRGYPQDIQDQEKYLDLFLSLGHTNNARSKLIEEFLKFSNASSLTSPDRCYIATNSNSPAFQHQYGKQIQDLLPWPDYIRRQANSKIGASMIGHGGDCLHTYELTSFETAMLYCPTGNYMPNPPKNLRDAIFIDESCSNVSRVLETLLNEDEFRIKIAKRGKLWCRTKHTCNARASYVVSVFEEIMAGKNPKDIAESWEIY